MTRRRGRRSKKLLDDLKDRRGYSHLKEEALDRTIWRNRFGRGFGPVVRLLNKIRYFEEWYEISYPKQNAIGGEEVAGLGRILSNIFP